MQNTTNVERTNEDMTITEILCEVACVFDLLDRTTTLSAELVNGDYAYTQEYHLKEQGRCLLLNYKLDRAYINFIHDALKRSCEDLERVHKAIGNVELQIL